MCSYFFLIWLPADANKLAYFNFIIFISQITFQKQILINIEKQFFIRLR